MRQVYRGEKSGTIVEFSSQKGSAPPDGATVPAVPRNSISSGIAPYLLKCSGHLSRYLTLRYNTAMTHEDHVSSILAQWAVERPDLDVSPMGIVGRISRLSLVVDRELEPVFAQFGLNHWSFDMLATLRRSGAPYQLSPTELFRSMMVTSGTMTNRIDRLTGKDLVRRIPDPEDRRGILVELTDQGRKLIDSALASHVSNEERLLQSLSPEEQSTLAALLGKWLSSLEGL